MAFPMKLRSFLLPIFLLWLSMPAARAVAPVAFSFHVPAGEGSPFLREIWAEVATPGGTMHVPAFFDGGDVYAVRLRASDKGLYRLLGAMETTSDGQSRPIELRPAGPAELQPDAIEALPSVRRDPADRHRLQLGDGRDFVPLGMNLAWAPGRRLAWYPETFRQFHENGLNWARIWMAHWGGLNLDWITPDAGKSPPAGELDLHIAAEWDRIVTSAEDNGVYIQMVLQHHGQWSSTVNSNWKDNPWNAANPGGFLRTPEEFYTSPEARRFTAAKFRYIVARWGYSPAVVAWELFNEVHWTDAMRHGQEADVAAWHAEMARRIRAADVWHHLVTTSTENLRSPVYADMDYYQPHCYGYDMLTSLRHFSVPLEQLDRPVFYGEMGDDHMPLTDAQKASGSELPPLVWASLMGEGALPAQIWQGDLVLAQKRLGEVGAVARFLAATRLAERRDLHSFTAVVRSEAQTPFVLLPGEVWQKEASPELTVMLDGRMPAAYAEIPRALVGAPTSVAEGFPDRVTWRVNYPRAASITVNCSNAGVRGAHAELTIDGRVAAEHVWPAAEAAADSAARPGQLRATVPAGEHVIMLRNHGGPDWCELASVDLGVTVSPLAAVGRRGDDFVALWIWHRTGVFATGPSAAVTGEVDIDAVPAGDWTVTWWDTFEGQPAKSVTVSHPGGMLRLPTPPIARHAAVVLTRTGAPQR